MSEVVFKVGDITELAVDAIVNPANNDLILGGGVAGAIRRVGGPAIQDECNKLAPIPLGEAVVTCAGSLQCKYVIHAAVMPLGLWADARSIRKAVINSIRRAEEKGVKTIAFPALGTGAGNFPVNKAADIMLSVINEHINTGKSSIQIFNIVLFDEKTYTEFVHAYEQLKAKESAGS